MGFDFGSVYKGHVSIMASSVRVIVVMCADVNPSHDISNCKTGS